MAWQRSWWCALLALALAGCGAPAQPGADAGPADAGAPTVAWFRLDDAPGPFRRPWPSDLDRDDAGFVRFDAVPNAKKNSLVRSYVQLAQGRFAGFPTTGAVYFRLDDDLDPASLPASLAASEEPGAAAQLVDVDPASPERGRRVPAQWAFQSAGTDYWTPHTLAVAPAPGFPLRPRTRYAAVLLRSARDAHGQEIAPDADLVAALGTGPASPNQERLRALLAPALAELDRAGVPAGRIAALSVLTTQDPTAELFAAMDAMPGRPAPALHDLQKLPTNGPYQLYSGHFGPVPDFQTGAAPYSTAGEGDFAFDGGAPVVQGERDLRFVLTVPSGPAPDGGFPVALYAHGTFGDAFSFVDDGTAARLDAEGLAGVSFDQAFHGERAVGSNELAKGSQYFNFFNPVALRRNIQATALDLASLAAALPALRVPASLAAQGAELRLDGSRVVSLTHSQGSLGGALWLAASGTDRAAVLSGAGGTPIFAITQKTPEFDALPIVAAVLGVPEDDAVDLGPLAPTFTVLRAFTDAASPANYARHLHAEPRPGLPPRSVFVTMGLVDSYVPDDEIGALAVAARLPQAGPVLLPFANAEALGLPVVTLPLRGNLASGAATGAWQQAQAPQGRDGHFVIFDLPDLGQRAARFLGEAARADGPPSLAP